jgi:hypothetical protein
MPNYPSRDDVRRGRPYRPYSSVKRRVHNSFLPDWMTPVFVYGGFFVAAILLQAGCAAAVPESKAVNAARDAGYSDIHVIDKAWFVIGFRGCDKNDTVRFTVRGISPAGEVRQFYVCAGFTKGGTIRSK